jgi:hypothetical protein
MLSPFLNLELMRPNQVGKEIIFNETIIQIEQLCSQMVLRFIDHPYKDLKKGLYIISKDGDRYHNHLTYPLEDRWKYIKPQENMIIFIEEKNSFFKFQQNTWKDVTLENKSTSSPSQAVSITTSTLAYTSIKGKYTIPSENDFLHLYINGDVKFEIKNHNSPKITLFIKQHHQKKYKLTWGGNCIFAKEQPALEENRLIVMNLYKTPEDDRYLAEVIGIYM